MKIYISGPITNNPGHKEQFEQAEKELTLRGYKVINPAKNQGYSYKDYMDIALYQLMHCDGIYLLKGWEKSAGARMEHQYARTVGMKIITEDKQETLTLPRKKKIAIISEYCVKTNCKNCKLNNVKWGKATMVDGANACLDVEAATEEDLDRAIVLIDYREE